MKARGSLFLAGWLLLLVLLPARGDYAVGPQDVLDVVVGDELSLSGTFPVSDEGLIIYPLLGALPVAGKTVPAITQLIRERLASDYLVAPQVAVYVKEYASKKVTVTGDVSTPGVYSLKNDTTLISLLTEAGAKLSRNDATIIVTRESPADAGSNAVPPIVIELDRLTNPWQDDEPFRLANGDRILVRSGSTGRVVVSGKVKKPGTVALADGMTVLEAINEAGGISEFGSLKGVRVIRESPEAPGRSETIELDLTAVMGGDRSKDAKVKDGDIIVVPRGWL